MKLADFGLARTYMERQDSRLTNRVITLWYRCDTCVTNVRYMCGCMGVMTVPHRRGAGLGHAGSVL